MLYKYVGYSDTGNEVRGVLEADSQDKAEALLWKAGLTIVSLQKKLALPALETLLPTLFGVKSGDVIGFTRDLSTLLEAGLPILRSLDILRHHVNKAAMRRVLDKLTEDLEKGGSFSEACAAHPAVFPTFYVRLLKVGEEVGNLPDILRELAQHMHKDAAVASKLKGSMGYPAFVLALAFASLVIMIKLVIPALQGLFSEFGAELPWLTRTVMDFGSFMEKNFVYLASGTVAFAVGGWWYTRRGRGRRQRDALLLRIPLIRDISLKGSLARFSRNMSMLLRSGVSLTEAMELAVDTAENAQVKGALIAIDAGIQAGQSLSEAMALQPIFPVLLTQMTMVGEETGNLESNMGALSGFYEQEAERATARLTSMLGPGMMIAVGIVVGIIAVSVFSSIYSVSGAL